MLRRLPLVALVAVLSACAASEQPSTTDPAATPPSNGSDETAGEVPAEPATPADQPSEDVPPANGTPDGDRNLARFGGYGDIDFGTVEADMEKAWGGELKTLGKDMNAQCFFMTPAWTKVPAALSFMIGDGKFVRYGTENAVLVAPGGGKIGMTKAEIAKLYGEVQAESHAYTDGEYLRIKDDAGKSMVIFETDAKGDDGKVTEWRVGVEPYVGYVEGCS